ncbi:zinc finger protein 37 [Stylonychia lemnae]|uniref:Zinc finger protein 37 n=1 Tax=Stylonychia lemnae TaxID=5949 RepID=A0A078A412_STYLE|nr:zinc finger protein 37 [Stylonychia lemnae]|eukprot:CDW76263.1 zinc finger protein 37 [Stylonychia lemnae]
MPKSTAIKNIKQFKCHYENCNNSYTRTFRLNFHIKTFHMGIKQIFKCQQCDRKFSEKSNLKIHQRKHSGEKPFQCEHCLRKFSAIGNMKDHQRRHLQEKPYTCPCCNKKFYRQYLLITHAKKMHSDSFDQNQELFKQKAQIMFSEGEEEKMEVDTDKSTVSTIDHNTSDLKYSVIEAMSSPDQQQKDMQIKNKMQSVPQNQYVQTDQIFLPQPTYPIYSFNGIQICDQFNPIQMPAQNNFILLRGFSQPTQSLIYTTIPANSKIQFITPYHYQ